MITVKLFLAILLLLTCVIFGDTLNLQMSCTSNDRNVFWCGCYISSMTCHLIRSQAVLPSFNRTSGDIITSLTVTNGSASNRIDSIYADVILKSVLTSIHLEKLNIQELHPGAFRTIDSTLVKIELVADNLQTLSVGTFDGAPKLTLINLYNNKIGEIKAGVFSGLSKLESLVLARNSIQSIDADAFNKLTSLKWLNLKNNKLHSIGMHFAGLESLVTIDISNNKGVSGDGGLELSDVAFKRLSSLRKLYLQNCGLNRVPSLKDMQSLTHLDVSHNFITALDNDAFQGVGSLIILDLSHNSLESVLVGALYPLRKLQKLHLDNNDISYVQPYAFQNLAALHLLDLEFNELLELPAEALSNLTDTLDVLKLAINRLETLSYKTLVCMSKLRQLTLYGNSLTCDCRLSWLRQLVSHDHYGVELVGATHCDRPAQVASLEVDTYPIDEVKCPLAKINLVIACHGQERYDAQGRRIDDITGPSTIATNHSLTHFVHVEIGGQPPNSSCSWHTSTYLLLLTCLVIWLHTYH